MRDHVESVCPKVCWCVRESAEKMTSRCVRGHVDGGQPYLVYQKW